MYYINEGNCLQFLFHASIHLHLVMEMAVKAVYMLIFPLKKLIYAG